MGGESKSSAEAKSQTQPWAPAQPALQSILSSVNGLAGSAGSLNNNQSGAIDQMLAYAKAGNPYAPAIDSYATTMLAGGGPDRTGLVSDAYNNYKTGLAGTAAGDNLDPNKNPWFSNVTNTIGNDVQTRLQGLYAGSGRNPVNAGSFGENLGRGIAQGTAPVFGQQYQFERGQQDAAKAALYGAGNTTGSVLSGLDQTRLGNMGQGVNAADQATQAANYGPMQTLAIEAQRTGIPISLLQQLAGIGVPIAGLGGTSNSTQTGTQQMSGAQQFGLIAQGLGSLFGGAGRTAAAGGG